MCVGGEGEERGESGKGNGTNRNYVESVGQNL